MGNKGRNRHVCTALAFAAAVLMTSACTGSGPSPDTSVAAAPTSGPGTPAPARNPEIVPHAVGAALPFECAGPIASGPTAESLGAVPGAPGVAGVMAVSARSVQWGGGAAYQGFEFAKVGLILKADTPFTLSVPASMRAAMKIGWSNSGYTLTDELVIPGCTLHRANADWLVYPGGFWLKAPGCVPLEVISGRTSRTIHIPIGTPCP